MKDLESLQRVVEILENNAKSYGVTLVTKPYEEDPFLRQTTAHAAEALPYDGYDRASIIEMWKQELVSHSGLHLIFDIDENLVNTVAFWIEETNQFLQDKYHIPPEQIPTLDEVLLEGGPSKYYPLHFPNIWNTNASYYDPSSYEYLAEQWRHETAGNLVPPLLDGLDVTTLLAVVTSHAHILGGLTARPATKPVIEATHQQFQQYGFETDRNFPIIFRPKIVELSQAGQEKLKVLKELLTVVSSQSRIILLDDSISTARIISEYNQSAEPSKKIAYILNTMGPLTAPSKDILTNNTELSVTQGIFMIKDWSEMDDILTTIEIWHTQNS